MNDYTALIERLRVRAEFDSIFGDALIFTDAANAIEKLSKQLAEYKKYDSFLAVHGIFDLPEEMKTSTAPDNSPET